VAGAEQRNARLANAVLANGSDNRVVVTERKVRTLTRGLCDDSYTKHSLIVAATCFCRLTSEDRRHHRSQVSKS